MEPAHDPSTQESHLSDSSDTVLNDPQSGVESHNGTMWPTRDPSTASSDSSDTELLIRGRGSDNVSFAQRYVLDIIVATYMMYTAMLSIPLTDAMMKKSCLYELHFNDSICEALNKDENKEYKDEVQRITKFYGLAMNLAGSLPAAVSVVIASNFMTRFGVRTPVILAVASSGMTSILQVYSCVQMDLPLYLNVIFQIPHSLAGGMLAIFTAAQTRIALITLPENRKYRYFLLRYLMLISNAIAVFIGAPIYKNFGPLILAAIVGALLSTALVLAIFLLRNIGVDSSESFCDALRKSIDFGSLRESLGCLKKQRPGHARAQIYFMLISLTIATIPFAGTDNLEQLYVDKIYQWDAVKFARITSYSLVAIMIASSFLFFIFGRVWHLSDPALMLLSFVSYTAKVFCKVVMFLGEYVFWIQLALGSPLVIGTTAAISHLTQLVAPGETALILGISSSLERVLPLIVDIGISSIYAATVKTFPGAVFIFEGSLFLMPVVFAMLCYHWLHTEGYPEYKEAEAEEA